MSSRFHLLSSSLNELLYTCDAFLSQVLQTATSALDDDKRCVRLAAGKCKRIWSVR